MVPVLYSPNEPVYFLFYLLDPDPKHWKIYSHYNATKVGIPTENKLMLCSWGYFSSCVVDSEHKMLCPQAVALDWPWRIEQQVGKSCPKSSVVDLIILLFRPFLQKMESKHWTKIIGDLKDPVLYEKNVKDIFHYPCIETAITVPTSLNLHYCKVSYERLLLISVGLSKGCSKSQRSI